MYTIVTDSSCDLPSDLLKTWNVKCANLNFTFDDSEEVFDNDKMPIDEFYKRMRAGRVSKTSAVNTETFLKIFEPELAAGNDILYVGFTSGLSTTYNSGAIAAQELTEKYPERTIIPVDTTCASGGEGLMVYYAVQQRDSGASIEDNAAFFFWKVCLFFLLIILSVLLIEYCSYFVNKVGSESQSFFCNSGIGCINTENLCTTL